MSRSSCKSRLAIKVSLVAVIGDLSRAITPMVFINRVSNVFESDILSRAFSVSATVFCNSGVSVKYETPETK